MFGLHIHRRLLQFVLSALLSVGCNTSMSDEEALKWLADPDNGLTSSIRVGAYVLRVTVMPSFVGKKHDDQSKLLTIKTEVVRADKEGGQDLMLDGIDSQEAFTQRLSAVAFQLHSNMRIVFDDGTSFSGVDTFFEQNYGLGDRRVMYVTFPIGEKAFSSSSHATLVWTDTDFGAGRVVFVFNPESLNDLAGFL